MNMKRMADTLRVIYDISHHFYDIFHVFMERCRSRGICRGNDYVGFAGNFRNKETNCFFYPVILFKHNRVPGITGNPLCEDVLAMFILFIFQFQTNGTP